MRNTVKVVKGVLSLAVLAFVVMFVWGVLAALDAAPLASAPAYGTGDADTYEGDAESTGNETAVQDSEAEDAAAMPDGESGDTGSENPLSPASSSSGEESAVPSSTTVQAGSPVPDTSARNAASSSSTPAQSGSTNAEATTDAPAPSAPQRVWVPAWDEWVVEGHWETRDIPATYGERQVFGSICNDCGVNISGQASAHLKATHHSGYHEGVVGHETYEIAPARTEQVWVDTSHWVTHPGYWQ